MICECTKFVYCCPLRGAFHDNFPGFLGLGFSGKLRAQKINKEQTKQMNLMDAQNNSWDSTWSGVSFVLFFYFTFSLWQFPNFDPLHGGCQLSLLPQSAAKILCLIQPAKTPLPLLISRVRYSGQVASLSAAPPQEKDLDTLELPLLLCWAGHHKRLPAQYAHACTTASLSTSYSLFLFSHAILIHRRPHNMASILLSLLSRLYTNYLLLLS